MLTTCARIKGLAVQWFDDGGWDAFKKARTIRNALTHPRREGDVEVTDEELDTVKLAEQWFIDNVTLLDE